MVLNRKIEGKIINWYESDSKALLIKGARQIGKTYAIRKVLNERNINYIEINLINTPQAIGVLSTASNISELIMGLSALVEGDFKKNETIIFIDEVQKYKEMITKIKFLVEEGSFRYIFSGSLLGVEITNIESAPVGYLKTYEMYPLDFEEFLQITNISTDVLGYARECFISRTPVMEEINNKLLKIFNQYLVVGGMPEAVSRFSESYNLNDVIKIHNDILDLYKLDFTQYENIEHKLMLSKVYDMIPAELLKQNRRFIVSDIKKGLRYERIESTFLWLIKAGVALSVYNTTEPKIPFKLNEKQSLFKLYLSDIGMLTSIYGMNTKSLILNADSHFNGGGLFENSIAQELVSKQFPLYYYNSNRLGELDFVTEYCGRALPIEVKSGKDYKIHSAMNHCLSNKNFAMDEGFVYAKCNVSKSGKVVYLPIYMISFLENENESDYFVQPIKF